MRRTLALILATLAPVLCACGSSSGSSSSSTGNSSSSASAAGQAPSGCQQVTAPAAKQVGRQKPPRRRLDPRRHWKLTVRTSCGDFTVALDLRSAPKASASMVSLARAGFFRGTVFHRIVPGFVIQGGDPTGSGAGGPGYSTVDRPPRGARYTRGVVAMAKTQAEPPGTAGSQFYVVTGADAGLPADYAVLGKVISGLDTVARIGALGDPASGGAGTPTAVVEVRDIIPSG
ncbi:MAG: hypothetical protein NVSMB25_09550 [Thermoleophilaceae bacterium]